MNVTSFEGTIVLTCVGTGFPIPSIAWFQNGSAIDPDQDNTTIVMYTSELFRNTTSKLRISMAMVNNSGFYHCNLSSPNYIDVMSQEALIKVQGESALMCTG